MTMSSSQAPGSTAESSDTQTVRSIQTIANDFTQLATNIAQDRDVHVFSKDFLLNAHVVGAGFVKDLKSLHDGDTDEESDEESEFEMPLFVEREDRDILMSGDSTYVDEGQPGEEDDELMEGHPVDDDEAYDEIIRWLNGLKNQITSLHQIPKTLPTCPNLAVEPKPHQLVALAKIEHNIKSSLKAVMIADPMGLGKTLIAMMAVVKAIATAKRFSIVVVTSSCLNQWKTEFDKFFLQDSVRVLVLRDPNTSPLELLKYDVVLVSYSFVMSQYRKLCKYVNSVARFKEDGVTKILERPNLSLFSEIFDEQGVKSPFLVLDEVTAIKNSSSFTFDATLELSKSVDTCVMLTGSPVDNTWMDLYAYFQFLSGHNIRTKPTMRTIFASQTASGKLGPPRGNHFIRLVQTLNSFVVRRPESIINLPTLHEQTVSFELNPIEANTSNFHFGKYDKIRGMKKKKDGVQTAGNKKLIGWKHLTKAMQHACHPELVRIMHLVRNPTPGDEAAADVLYEAKDIEEWIAWREVLKQGDNWKSSRITALIDIFNKARDLDPECSVIVFDESVYFLDIVEIAFSSMYEPVECLRFDGRTIPEKRTAILHEFADTNGANVLLASRGAGGVGLNITAANVVILCGPWWKSEWENQAIKRAHRPGQVREVHAYKLKASNCSLETYKSRVRDKKHKHNSQIVSSITRPDADMPKVWDELED